MHLRNLVWVKSKKLFGMQFSGAIHTLSVVKLPLAPTKVDNRLEGEDQVKQKDASRNGAYYDEFMKLWSLRRESPFVYRPFKSRAKLNCPDQSHRPYRYVMLGEKSASPLPSNVSDSQLNSFIKLGVKAEMVLNLEKHGIVSPLPVQEASLPYLLSDKKVIIESETGSGKTLCFLIPILQDMGSLPCSNIIITPSRELVTQIHSEILKFVKTKDYVCKLVSGVDDAMTPDLKKSLRSSKIIISTPKRLLEVLQMHTGYFRNVKRLVVDECDKLLPYVPPANRKKQKVLLKNPKPTEVIVAMLSKFRKSTQLIACSASIERGLVENLQDMGWTKYSQVIRTKRNQNLRFGEVPKVIKHQYLVVDDHEPEFQLRSCAQLLQTLKQDPVLLFVDRTHSVLQAVDFFKSRTIPAAALYKELLHPGHTKYEQFVDQFRTGQIRVVVANEETVRGLDFPFLNHVIILYVPTSPIGYLHLAGRVGRLGRPGTVTTIIGESNKYTEIRHLKRRYMLLGIQGSRVEIS